MHGSQPAGGADTAALLARLAAAFTSYHRALPALVELADLRRRPDEPTADWRARILRHLSRHERELAALEQLLVRAADGPWRAARPLLDATPETLARMGGADPALALTRDLWSLWWRAAGFPDGTATVVRWQEGARRLRRLTLSLLVLARLGRRFARDALARFAAEIADPGTATLEPDRLHDRWIDACETAYSALVFTPRYSRAFGRVVNEAVGTRVAIAATLEPLLIAAGMPTRADLARIVAAQHALTASLEAMQTVGSMTTPGPPANEGAAAPGAVVPAKPGRSSRSAVPVKPVRPVKRARGNPAKRARGNKPRQAPWDIAVLQTTTRDE